jgi:hypothetical protein
MNVSGNRTQVGTCISALFSFFYMLGVVRHLTLYSQQLAVLTLTSFLSTSTISSRETPLGHPKRNRHVSPIVSTATNPRHLVSSMQPPIHARHRCRQYRVWRRRIRARKLLVFLGVWTLDHMRRCRIDVYWV